MTEPGFETACRRLPSTLPIFPLPGVLLLPRGRLPLNVFEPRYINMTDDALAGDRMIGMIQPTLPEPRGVNPPIYRTGCAGRITSFAEEGGRYLITLTGVSRFDVVEEVPTTRGYRRVVPDWSHYAEDLREEPAALMLDRPRLIAGLKGYFKRHGISVEWKAIEATPAERLVTSLAMICPFAPPEKQALLEARSLVERSKVLIGLVELDVLAEDDGVRH